jgi:hypothetical protein
MRRMVFSAVLGAAIMFFLDPKQGRRRRNITRDRVGATLRGGARKVLRASRKVVSQGYGAQQRLTHAAPEHPVPPNDATLAHKVESEIFRHRDVPTGRVNVNVEDGIVVLRGQLDRLDDLQHLEAAARHVAGVRGVRSLLHLPGTPAPTN